jgi:RNA recognition motif-containing protein
VYSPPAATIAIVTATLHYQQQRTDRETGNSRGFGFVTYATPDSAQAAIANLDGREMGGREIRVNISEPKKPRY